MDERIKIKQRLKDDLIHYAAKCLRIRTKSGDIEAFALNKAQLHIHNQLEMQRGQTGKVRALILKGRQQGCSTYIQARYFSDLYYMAGIYLYSIVVPDRHPF